MKSLGYRKPPSDEDSERGSSSFLPLHSSTVRDRGFVTKPLMLWPLALHFLGSIGVAVTLVLALDGCHLHVDRQPRVKLADGTIETDRSGYKLLQSDATTNVEEHVFKRVVPSAAKLVINSTIDSVPVPYFTATKMEWLPNGEEHLRRLPALQKGNRDIRHLFSQLRRPGVLAMVVNYTEPHVNRMDPAYSSNPYSSNWTETLPASNWTETISVLINVGREINPLRCDSSTTFLPKNTTIPYFYAGQMPYKEISGSACFAYANVTYIAGSGMCKSCRIGSYFTVQNDTELEIGRVIKHDDEALYSLPQYVHTFAQLSNSLPDPADNLDAYVKALLTRSYSSLWITWAGTRQPTQYPSTDHPPPDHMFIVSNYRPSFPTLKAEIDKVRVAIWLALQHLITLSGLLFIWLQSSSGYPLVTDTSMVAFDIDSTEVPKPSESGKEPNEKLRIEPDGDSWKVVVTSGRRKHDFE